MGSGQQGMELAGLRSLPRSRSPAYICAVLQRLGIPRRAIRGSDRCLRRANLFRIRSGFRCDEAGGRRRSGAAVLDACDDRRQVRAMSDGGNMWLVGGAVTVIVRGVDERVADRRTLPVARALCAGQAECPLVASHADAARRRHRHHRRDDRCRRCRAGDFLAGDFARLEPAGKSSPRR